MIHISTQRFPPCQALVCALFASGVLAIDPTFGQAQTTIEVSDTLVTIIEQVRVPALREGPVIKLDVSEGDVVQVGQLLAKLDDREPLLAQAIAKSEYDAAIKPAESELAVQLARKKYDLAISDLRRAEKARSMLAGSMPDEEYENRKLQVDRTELEIDKSTEDRENAIAQARLFANDYRRAALSLNLTRVVSPISGVVVSIERREGEWAKAGDTILEILGTTRLRAEAMIDISRIRQSLTGKSVTLELTLPDGSSKNFSGVIRFESPEINPLDNRVSVWAEIANPDGYLRPGMRGRMIIDLSNPAVNERDQTRHKSTATRTTTTPVETK